MQHRPTQPSVDAYEFEKRARDQGFRRVVGVDEVGRGPLAGPVVAAAVFLPLTGDLPPFRDSKALTHLQRVAIFEQLKGVTGASIGVGIVDVETIDRINILRATALAMRQAILDLPEPADFALVDGHPVKDLPVPSQALIKGDARCASIAAASIVAKVTRDAFMAQCDEAYPGYNFAAHKGYGTAGHLALLREHGPSPIHRRSFRPVANLINGGYFQPDLDLESG